MSAGQIEFYQLKEYPKPVLLELRNTGARVAIELLINHMPTVNVGDHYLYYETSGDPAAPPLLIISGLSDYTPKCAWQVADLAEDFFVVTFDNRGAGRSSPVSPGYSVADMMVDAVAVLDALNISQAHVFGFSLGGMSALHLTLNHPDRVERLILGCTTAGGPLTVYPDESAIAALVQPQLSGDRRDDFYSSLWMSVSDRSMQEKPHLIKALEEISMANPQSPEGYAGQIQALLSHDVAGRLGEIQTPTLIMHGEDDRMIPPENGRLLAEHIQGAKLIVYPAAGHLFFIEQAETVNRDIRRFLSV